MKTTDISKEEILSALNFRHATKEFDSSKKLSDQEIKFILQVANLSPSSFGFEPWHFIVVQDKELREALKPVAWGAPLKIRYSKSFCIRSHNESSNDKMGCIIY